MLLIFALSMFKSFSKVPGYSSYDSETVILLPLQQVNNPSSGCVPPFCQTHQHMVPYPNWALFIAFGLVILAMAPVPFIWFVRKFKIWRVEADIPVVSNRNTCGIALNSLMAKLISFLLAQASKCLGSTQSTAYMLRSEMSFNRILESAVNNTTADRNGFVWREFLQKKILFA